MKVLLVTAVLATVSGGVYVLFFHRAPPPVLPPLPNPNGYDDLVRAARMAVRPGLDPDEASLETLRKHVEANREALELARVGLSRECRVPLVYTTDPGKGFSFDAPKIALVGNVFEAEGRLAEREGRAVSAMRSYLDLVRLGLKASRGGLVIDRLVGDRPELSGLQGLERIAAALGPTECKQAIAALESAEREREPFDKVVAREAEWSRTVYTAGQRLWNWYRYGVRDDTFRRRLDGTVASLRRLLIDLAVRSYTLEKGKPPTRAADLVPDYLFSVPVDPTTGEPLTLPAGPVPEPARATSPSRP